MIIARYDKKIEKEEDLESHTRRVVDAIRLTSRKRKKALRRVFKRLAEVYAYDIDDETLGRLVNDAFYYAALLHDIGKTAEDFQRMLKRQSEEYEKFIPYAVIRHEIISAYLAYAGFLKDYPTWFKKAVSRAIMLHHQKRMIGKIKCSDAQYRLTTKLFKTLGSLPGVLDKLLDPGFIPNWNNIIEEVKKADVDATITDLLSFGTNPLEKAAVDIILASLVEADRKAVERFREGKNVPNIEIKIDSGVSITPELEYITIESPNIDPVLDTLRTLGLLEAFDVNEGLVYSNVGRYTIKVPKNVIINKIGTIEGRIRDAVAAGYNLLQNNYSKIIGGQREIMLYKNFLKTGEADVESMLFLVLASGGSKGRKPYRRGDKLLKGKYNNNFKDAFPCKEALQNSDRAVYLSKALVLIGFTYYVLKINIEQGALFAYPIIKQGVYPAALLRMSKLEGVTHLKNVKHLPFYGALWYTINHIALALEPYVFDYMLIYINKTGKQKQPAIRSSALLSAYNLRDFTLYVVDKIIDRTLAEEKGFININYINRYCDVIDTLFDIEPYAAADIAQGIEKRNPYLVYRGIRVITKELAKGSSKKKKKKGSSQYDSKIPFIRSLLQYVIERISK